jgi:hypothetical protein
MEELKAIEGGGPSARLARLQGAKSSHPLSPHGKPVLDLLNEGSFHKLLFRKDARRLLFVRLN